MTAAIETFKSRAEAVSAEVHRFAAKADALQFILEFLRSEGICDAPRGFALWADGPFLNGVDKQMLSREVPGLRFEITRELAAEAKIGISQMDWGIANTGTLVQDAAAADRRLVSTLPPIHIALLQSERLLADLPSLLNKSHPDQTNYISFITGPSRTADIERVLTIGVHGPERLIIVVVDEAEGVS